MVHRKGLKGKIIDSLHRVASALQKIDVSDKFLMQLLFSAIINLSNFGDLKKKKELILVLSYLLMFVLTFKNFVKIQKYFIFFSFYMTKSIKKMSLTIIGVPISILVNKSDAKISTEHICI